MQTSSDPSMDEQAKGKAGDDSNDRDIHIECDGVWKIFGDSPDDALNLIRTENLDKSEAQERHNCVIGVSDVSLRIRKGEIFCIMGLSGSGKSTLLRHINRLIEPTEGRVLINGQDIAELDAKGLQTLRAKTIGMVFQHMALWPHRTIQDNVAYGLEVRGVGRKERRKIAVEILDQMQLAGWETHYPDELSGGMQQRVGLARALAADPDILLMDEPFSALDPLIRADLQGQFLELAARLHKTTLFVTHDLEEAIRMGHRVAIMKGGEVVQVGTPEDIVLNPQGEYVERFVQGISRLRFLTARQIMRPAKDREGTNGTETRIGPQVKLHGIIDALRGVDSHLEVHDGDSALGVIAASDLLTAVRDFSPDHTSATEMD